MSSPSPSSHASPPRALLLLPPPPAPPTYAALKAAYNAPVFSVLRELARSPRRAQNPAILEIALPCPHLYGLLDQPRGPLYATTQQLVADLYKLICVIAANEAIDTEDAEGVDARIILVSYPRNSKLVQPANDSTAEEQLQGPAIDLHTLARTPRQWHTVYSVESEEGEGVLKNFLSLSSSSTPRNVSKVRGGIVHVEPTAPDVTTTEKATTTHHYSVILGGTFDHLHIGHKLLLTMFAFVLSRRPSSTSADASQSSGDPSTLTIGITGDALLKNKKYADQLESWKKRQEATHEFLSSILYFGPADDQRIGITEINEPGPNGHAVHVTYPFNLVIKYVEIWDPYGPTITDPSVTAIVVSLETRGGGAAVNSKRAELNWGQLEVFEVDVLDASEEANVDETFQSKLSSTEIRRKRSERAGSRANA